MKKVIIIDLNNLWMKSLYVCNYVLEDHLYYMLNYIRNLYLNKQYDKIYLVLDGKDNSAKSKYERYKEGRVKREGCFNHLHVFISIVSKYVKVLLNKTAEGDFVTAKLATFLLNKGYEVTIYSNDKDFLQLAQFGIKISDKIVHGKAVELTTEEILMKFKNTKKEPLDKLENILKYRVFKGDSSDRIPSAVKGLYDKDIREIINIWEGNSLTEDKLCDIISKVQNEKIKAKLEANKDNILRNYSLMNLINIRPEVLKNANFLIYGIDIKEIRQWKVKDWQVTW